MKITLADNNSLRRLKALFIKEFFQIIRDPSSILISLILPLILLFIYGVGVSLDINHLKIGVILEDKSPEAISFVQSLTDSKYFDVKIAENREILNEDIVKGYIRGIVVIPSYFTAFSYRQNYIAPIQVIADGSEPNTANFVQNYVRAAWLVWLQTEQISKKLQFPSFVNVQPRYWYNEELRSQNFLVPGSLAIIMTLIGTLLTALVIAREWERGTMEALMSTPVTIYEIIIGKLVPYFCLGMLSMTLCVIVAIFIYKIPFRGSFILLGIASSVFLISALGIGLLISTVSRNQFVAAQAAMVAAFLPGFILSGFIFEISSMPLWIQAVTWLIPARYFVTSLQTLFLAGNVKSLLFGSILCMIIFSIVIFFIIDRISVKRLD